MHALQTFCLPTGEAQKLGVPMPQRAHAVPRKRLFRLGVRQARGNGGDAFKMNCDELCGKFRSTTTDGLRQDNWRPHLMCLTCFLRRFYYKKRGWEGLKRTKRIHVYAESVNPRGTIMPKHFVSYFIFIDQRQIVEQGYWKIWRVKNFIVKNLLAIAEFIAQL